MLNLPEESVVFNANFPQLLSGPMIGQLETNSRFVLFELSGSDLDVEIVAFVADFQDLRPSEAIDT